MRTPLPNPFQVVDKRTVAQKPTTHAYTLRQVIRMAKEAHGVLSTKAADGTRARPTVAQLNKTLDILLDIQIIACKSLER